MAGRQSEAAVAMKRHILSLLRRGLVSPPEAAQIGQVSLMTVWRWCKQAKLDPERARTARIAAMMTAAERISAGDGVRDDIEPEHHPRSGPSKETLRKQAEWATMQGQRGEHEQ